MRVQYSFSRAEGRGGWGVLSIHCQHSKICFCMKNTVHSIIWEHCRSIKHKKSPLKQAHLSWCDWLSGTVHVSCERAQPETELHWITNTWRLENTLRKYTYLLSWWGCCTCFMHSSSVCDVLKHKNNNRLALLPDTRNHKQHKVC